MRRQEARQSARASSGEAKYKGIFNGKCVQCKGQWKLVHVGTFQCGKAEQWKSVFHPLLHTVPAKKIRYPATLADAWQELGAILAINWRGGGSGNLVGGNPAKPGTTDLAKAWNPSEPSGTRRSGGTQRNPAEPGRGTRQNPAEPGGNLAEPGGKKVSWRGGVGSINHAKNYTPNHPPFNLLFFHQVSAKFPPGSARFCRVLVGSRRVSTSLGLLQG